MERLVAPDTSTATDADALSALADIERLGGQLQAARTAIGKVIFGQHEVIDQTLVALLSGGHVLLIGVPGLAKTRLVETLGIVLGIDDQAHPVHARPDAGRHPRLRGAGGSATAAAAPSASSRARCSASC